MLNENTVNAVVEEVVTPQEPEQAEVVESAASEVATETQPEEVTEPSEKPVQSKEENSKYAEVRKKAEQAAQDKLIDEMYGKSHDIHTKADYDKALKSQRETELLDKVKNGEDPETVKKELYEQWEKSDPRLQEYEKMRTETYTSKQLSELNADLKEVGIDPVKSLDDVGSLPSADKVIALIKDGKTLSEAYFLANKKDIIQKQADKIQQDTIKKIQANGSATPGSLADNGETPSLYTREQVDAMSQSDVNKNYDLIMKSMKSW